MLLLLPACGKTKAHVDVCIQNHSANDIAGAEVLFGQHGCTAGIVGAGFGKTTVDNPDPITPKATLKWEDTGGKKHEQVVDVEKVYDLKSGGVLTFEIRKDDTVSVLFRKQ